MSDSSYPGAPIGDSVENVDDGELLDPAPRVGDIVVDTGEDVVAVIEGEAVDLDESAADAESDAAPSDGEQDEPTDEVDDAAGEQSQEVADRADSGSSDSGSNGTGVLVLETWQIQIPATGDATVDAALARLTDVEGLPPAQHADVYEAVHAGLHEALADLDRA